MAKLHNGLFQDIHGRVGELIFKKWRGVRYVITRPSTYTVKQTPYHIKSVSDFKFSSGFTAALNKIEVFKYLWNTAERPANVMIMGSALKIMRNGGTFKDLALLPAQGGFCPVEREIYLTGSIFGIVFEPAGTLLNMHDCWISLQGVLCLSNPQDAGGRSFCFIPVNGGHLAADPASEMLFEIKFTDMERDLINSYSDKKILLNLITKKRNGEVCRYSVNIYREL